MCDRYTPILCVSVAVAGIVALLLLAAPSHADVVGRLRFSVKNAEDEKPIEGAKITLKDSAGIRPNVVLTTDPQGGATSPEIEARAWQATTQPPKEDTFQPDSQAVTVVAGTVTEVEILLEPLKEKTVKVTTSKSLVAPRQTNESTQRTRDFLNTYPVQGSNPFSLSDVLRSTPGMSQDSIGQEHARGEHNATALYDNGFYLPSAMAGRIGSILTPETIQSMDILTGAYAPEYGGETAAILNINLRSGSIVPIRSFSLGVGGFGTEYGALTVGGQAGARIGPATASGDGPRRFGYLLDFDARTTQNALEPPQPGDQTAHNAGSTINAFGNFDYYAGKRDQFTLTLNTSPANTDVANRTGLPASFATVGQGYGNAGARNADGTLPGANTNLLGGGTIPLLSQQAAGQDITQRDGTDFGVLNWRHTFDDRLSGLLSLGMVHSLQEIRNGNPTINMQALPVDNSIEYNPTIVRNAHHVQPQGSLTYVQGQHTVKGGFLVDEQEGDESYQLIPGSQLALDSLFAAATNLAPAGTPQVDAHGQPVMDAEGHQVYLLNPGVSSAPIVNVHRSGFYRAAYLQDTWNATRRLTLNYGLRYDAYRQSQNLGNAPVDQGDLSPRINLAYLLARRTVGQISYNRLFIQPPLAQGAVLGASIVPETVNQYDASITRQIAQGQTLKAAYYVKSIRNQIDTGLLIPFTQIGVFSTVNFTNGRVHGLELSYNLTPKNNVGVSAYATYTNSLAKPTGVDNLGNPAPTYNDHDQLNTINVGAAYTWKSGANVGVNLYYGSGLASSSLVNLLDPSLALENGNRQSNTQVSLALSTGPNFFKGGHGGLTVDIENIFDDRSVMNFDSGFSGTRFVQGRRILLSANGKF